MCCYLLLVGFLALFACPGLSETGCWTQTSCPPNNPLAYCTIAEYDWIGLCIDNSRNLMALTSAWRTEILELYSGKLLASLAPPPGTRFNASPAFSPDGNLIALPLTDNSLRVWNWRTGVEVFTFPTASWGSVSAFSHDGKLLAGVGSHGEVIVWHLPTGEPAVSLLQLQTLVGPFVLGFSSDDKILFARALLPASGAHITIMWDVETGRTVQVLPGIALFPPGGPIYLLEPRPDWQTQLWIWNKEQGRVWPMTLLPGPMVGASLSGDGQYLALALANGKVRILDIRNGQELGQLDPRMVIHGTEESQLLVYVFFISDSLVATATRIYGTSLGYLHLWNILGLFARGKE